MEVHWNNPSCTKQHRRTWMYSVLSITPLSDSSRFHFDYGTGCTLWVTLPFFVELLLSWWAKALFDNLLCSCWAKAPLSIVCTWQHLALVTSEDSFVNCLYLITVFLIVSGRYIRIREHLRVCALVPIGRLCYSFLVRIRILLIDLACCSFNCYLIPYLGFAYTSPFFSVI